MNHVDKILTDKYQNNKDLTPEIQITAGLKF